MHFFSPMTNVHNGVALMMILCLLLMQSLERILEALTGLWFEQLCRFQEGTLKWKSQDMTNANTIQANKKFRNRWPCQKFRDWDEGKDVVAAAAAAASLISFHDSVSSASGTPDTFCATDPQISQVLHIRTRSKFNGRHEEQNALQQLVTGQNETQIVAFETRGNYSHTCSIRKSQKIYIAEHRE